MDRQREADELELDLPAPDGDLGPEEELPPADAEDLDPEIVGGQEQVGMDDDVGIDEPLDALKLTELVDDEEEDPESLALESEPADDLAGAEDDLIDGEEDGWTEGSEPADEEGWDGIEDLSPMPEGASAEDGGEEGFEDAEVDLGDREDDAPLPALDSSDDEDEDEARESEELARFGIQLLDQISSRHLIPEERVTVAPGVVWEKIPEARVALRRLGRIWQRPDHALSPADERAEQDGSSLTVPRLTSVPGQTLAWGSGLYAAVDDQAAGLSARGLSGAAEMSVAIDPNNPKHLAVGTEGGVLLSTDGGNVFGPIAVPTGLGSGATVEAGPTQSPSGIYAHGPAGFEVAFTSTEDASRLWVLPRQGGLFQSADLGDSWTQVSEMGTATHLVSDGRLALAVLSFEDDDSASVARSADEGRHWSALEVPNSVRPWVTGIAVCRNVVLLCHSGTQLAVLYAGRDGLWSPVTPLARPPAALVEEDGEATAYVCVPTGSGVALARKPLGKVNRPPVVVLQLHEMPACLSAAYEDDATTLHFIVSGHWYRARVGQDGE